MQQKAAEEAKARKAAERAADKDAEAGAAPQPKPASERGASSDIKPPEGSGSNGG